MTMDVVVVGAAASTFGLFVDLRLRDITASAVDKAMLDAGVTTSELNLVIFGNAAAGLLTGQEMIRAQTSLGESSAAGIPTMSVENACASSSTAFHLGCLAVASGEYRYVLVVGAEKMTHEDRGRAGRALATAVDVERGRRPRAGTEVDPAEPQVATPRPVFMEIYAAEARAYMERSGATANDFAAVVAKATHNGSLNPIAQSRTALSAEEVLAARSIVDPLTRPMCSSIGDGAAALVLCSSETARVRGQTGPRVLASVVHSGRVGTKEDVVEGTVVAAYERAGVGPEDLNLAEVHDAAAPAELIITEELGLVGRGDGPKALRDGTTTLGGSCPVNPSGGLLARGHPIGATGAAQIVELVDQLRRRSGARQVEGARIGLAENAGGSLGSGPAACAVTILGS